MKNFGLKVFSLFVALMLYFYVTAENNTSVMGISVPIEVKNLPPDKMLLWPVNPRTQVTVKGPSYLVKQVTTTNYVLPIRAPSEITSRLVVELDVSEIGLPPSIEVLGVDPAQLELTFDNRISKNLPVSVTETGTLGPDLQIVSRTIRPERIKVFGPEHEVNSITAISTELLNLSDVQGRIQSKLKLRAPSGFFSLEPNEVEVTFEVRPLTIEREFKNFRVEMRSNGATKFAIEPNQVNFEVSGPKSVVTALEPHSLVPFIQLNEQNVVGDKLKIELDLPAKVSIISIDSPQVTLVEPAPKVDVSHNSGSNKASKSKSSGKSLIKK